MKKEKENKYGVRIVLLRQGDNQVYKVCQTEKSGKAQNAQYTLCHDKKRNLIAQWVKYGNAAALNTAVEAACNGTMVPQTKNIEV